MVERCPTGRRVTAYFIIAYPGALWASHRYLEYRRGTWKTFLVILPNDKNKKSRLQLPRKKSHYADKGPYIFLSRTVVEQQIKNWATQQQLCSHFFHSIRWISKSSEMTYPARESQFLMWLRYGSRNNESFDALSRFPFNLSVRWKEPIISTACTMLEYENGTSTNSNHHSNPFSWCRLCGRTV